MKIFKQYLINFFLTTIILSFVTSIVIADEKKIEAIVDQVQILTQDIKTLEKAVYKSSDVTSLSSSSSGLNEDVLTKHLLKLNKIEDQFQALTNKFEEINFKLDKLSTRISKIQSDSQLRFSDLENNDNSSKNKLSRKNKQKQLPGSDKAQDFGAAPGYSTANLPKKQSVNSIDTTTSVFTEKAEKTDSLLPNKPALDQYNFAVSFIKIGDYETAEFA